MQKIISVVREKIDYIILFIMKVPVEVYPLLSLVTAAVTGAVTTLTYNLYKERQLTYINKNLDPFWLL